MPPGVSWDRFVQPVSIPSFTCIICAKFIPNRPAVWPHFPGFWIVDPLNNPPPPIPPWGIVCELCLAYVHSQMNPQTCTECDANRSIRLAAFPDLNVWPLRPPEMTLEGRIVFSYVHSQTNPQTCTKFGANRSSSLTASPDIWICDPLKPPKMPLGYWGVNCI